MFIKSKRKTNKLQRRNKRNWLCPCGSKKKFKQCHITLNVAVELGNIFPDEFHSPIFIKELEKDIRYSEKNKAEIGLMKLIVRGYINDWE